MHFIYALGCGLPIVIRNVAPDTLSACLGFGWCCCKGQINVLRVECYVFVACGCSAMGPSKAHGESATQLG